MGRQEPPGVRGLSRPLLVLALVLFAVLSSGCLGVFEESGDKSPEEVREEFVGSFDSLYHFTINVTGDRSAGFDSVMFDGVVVGGGSDGYMEISGDYIERNSSTGEEIGRTYYDMVLRDSRLNLTVADEIVSIEDVGRDDLGSTYDVNLSNRSQWSFVTPQDEVQKLLRSDVYDEKERVDITRRTYRESVKAVEATRLKPDKDNLAELLNKQYESPMGKRVLNLTADDIAEAQVHLVEQEPPNSKYMIHIKVETEDGRKIMNTIFS